VSRHCYYYSMILRVCCYSRVLRVLYFVLFADWGYLVTLVEVEEVKEVLTTLHFVHFHQFYCYEFVWRESRCSCLKHLGLTKVNLYYFGQFVVTYYLKVRSLWNFVTMRLVLDVVGCPCLNGLERAVMDRLSVLQRLCCFVYFLFDADQYFLCWTVLAVEGWANSMDLAILLRSWLDALPRFVSIFALYLMLGIFCYIFHFEYFSFFCYFCFSHS